MHEASLPVYDPPSSPPSIFLLTSKVMKQRMAQTMKTTTLNPSEPAGTQQSFNISPDFGGGVSVPNLSLYLFIQTSPQGNLGSSAAGT